MRCENNVRYVKRPYYDIDEILENVTGREVAEYFNLDIIRKGSNDYIHCPGHLERLGKEDYKAGNCVLTEHGYHCFACHETVGILRMIEEIEGCSKYEAIGIAGDIAGGRELYQISGEDIDSMDIQKKERLGSEDLKFIGLLKFKRRAYFPKQVITYEQTQTVDKKMSNITKHYINGENGDLDTEYLLCERKKKFGINQLYQDDYDAYCILIRNKALETIRKYRELLEVFCKPSIYQSMLQQILPYNMQSLKNEYMLSLNHAYKIYLRFQ